MVMEAGTWYTDNGKMIQVGRISAVGTDTARTCCSGADNSCCVGAAATRLQIIPPCSFFAFLHAVDHHCIPAEYGHCMWVENVTSESILRHCCAGGAGGTVAGGFIQVPFHTPFPDNDVSIIPQVQTYNDQAFVKCRTQPLTSDSNPPGTPGSNGAWNIGFQVALEREGSATASGSAHGLEAVGYMAFQHTNSDGDTIGGDLYMADQTDMTVTSSPTSGGIDFCVGFTQPPLLFAAIATYSGSDSAELRLSVPTTAGQSAVYIEEEGCSDTETDHIAEVVSFFAISHSANHKIRATSQAPIVSGAGTPSYTWNPSTPGCGAATVGPASCGERTVINFQLTFLVLSLPISA